MLINDDQVSSKWFSKCMLLMSFTGNKQLMTTTINDHDDDNQSENAWFSKCMLLVSFTGGENPWSHTAGWLPHGPPSCGDAENHGLDLDGHDGGGADDADADADGDDGDGGDRY